MDSPAPRLTRPVIAAAVPVLALLVASAAPALLTGPAAGAPAALPVGELAIKPRDSRVEFAVKDNRGGFTGQTGEVTGTVVVRRSTDGGYAAEVSAKIDARTIRTGVGLRDNQMRGERFLNTGAFPFITFTGTAAAGTPGAAQFAGRLRGTLTIKRAEKVVEVPLQITVDPPGYTARGEVVVRMSDFGIPLPRFLFFVAEDPVTVRLSIRLVPG